MKSSTKKEVPCKAFDTIFYYAKQKEIDFNSLVVGIPYDLTHLLNKGERVEWWVWCKVISNLRQFFSYRNLKKWEEVLLREDHIGKKSYGLFFFLLPINYQGSSTIRYLKLVHLCFLVLSITGISWIQIDL